MSLVNFALAHDFVLVGGDTRASDIHQNVVSNNHKKVVKLNKEIIIGCSGNARDCHLFINKYCDFSKEQGLKCKQEECKLKYTDIISELNYRYEDLRKIHYDKKNNILYNFTVVVCGYNGNDFSAVLYCLTDNLEGKTEGIFPIEVNPYTGVKCFSIGSEYLQLHINNYNEGLRKNQPNSILQHKNVMQKVFDMGIKFDKTINNFCVYEKIRRKDVAA